MHKQKRFLYLINFRAKKGVKCAFSALTIHRRHTYDKHKTKQKSWRTKLIVYIYGRPLSWYWCSTLSYHFPLNAFTACIRSIPINYLWYVHSDVHETFSSYSHRFVIKVRRRSLQFNEYDWGFMLYRQKNLRGFMRIYKDLGGFTAIYGDLLGMFKPKALQS